MWFFPKTSSHIPAHCLRFLVSLKSLPHVLQTWPRECGKREAFRIKPKLHGTLQVSFHSSGLLLTMVCPPWCCPSALVLGWEDMGEGDLYHTELQPRAKPHLLVTWARNKWEMRPSTFGVVCYKSKPDWVDTKIIQTNFETDLWLVRENKHAAEVTSAENQDGPSETVAGEVNLPSCRAGQVAGLGQQV